MILGTYFCELCGAISVSPNTISVSPDPIAVSRDTGSVISLAIISVIRSKISRKKSASLTRSRHPATVGYGVWALEHRGLGVVWFGGLTTPARAA